MYAIQDANGHESATGIQTVQEAIRIARRFASDCGQVRYVVEINTDGEFDYENHQDALVVQPA